jgi:hypothetical protein
MKKKLAHPRFGGSSKEHVIHRPTFMRPWPGLALLQYIFVGAAAPARTFFSLFFSFFFLSFLFVFI